MMLTDEQKREKIRILEAKRRLKEQLPHLHAFKDYRWAKEFLESKNRMCFITAGNQLGKSTVQIRKMIWLATSPEEWTKWWPTHRPNQFWYLYPSKDICTLEFETKWKYLLPQGSMKTDPIYGWKEIYDNKKIYGIKFNTGVLLVFKTYSQDASNLQAGTVFYTGTDEECPAELVPELMFRLAATNGYYSAVFTPTLGQEMFRLIMEERGKHEKFPDAAKWRVSLYDCQTFADGSPSHWTPERITDVIAKCGSEAEVQMRVFGKFVMAEGRIFEAFSLKDNIGPGGKIPKDYLVYSGIDYGSGGEKGHPASICFVAVKPDFTYGRVVRAWRGDGIQTEATDIMKKHRSMRLELQNDQKLTFITARYDQSCRDLFTISTRMSEPVQAAEKSHSVGVPIMNSLFKNRMLELDGDQDEVMKLAHELAALRVDMPKTKAKDDLADACRYATSLIPFNWSIVHSATKTPDTHEEPERILTETEQRRAHMDPKKVNDDHQIEEEFDAWNEAYEG